MVEVKEITIAQAQDGFRRGDFTAKDLATTFLERIEKLDKAGPRVNATLAMSTTALDDAAALDEYFRNTKKFKGRLHGIPVLVKDQADTKGMVTTYGSDVTRNNIPDEDATVVTKLKEAGAVILGKTTMAEWAAVWYSGNAATNYEYTKNPYNLNHDVSGSSGGSAAAVAANFTVLAVAEDTGGSIRVPSSFCNLVGIRVTPGLISRHGFCPLIKNHDTPGPMARTVTDCALMLDCMVGFDPKDDFTGFAATAAALGLPSNGSYAANLDQGPSRLKKAKIGVVRQRFGPVCDPYCKAVNTVISAAMDMLSSAGTTFIDVHIDNLDHYLDYTQTYTIRSRSDINEFLAAKPHLPQDIADILPKEPPKHFMDFLCAVAHGPKDPQDDPTYLDRILQRDELKRKLDCLIASLGLDALTLPDVQVPPPHFEDWTKNGRFEGKEFPTNTFLASMTRLPAVTVSVGFTENGLPVGIEFIGLEHQEQHLLELARGVEVIVAARRAPPGPL
ncbi:amidase signature domain-containing protein [Pseudomassariella vexata]|uniref:Amidase signature domain-containing protein n=1 Tax=Pseudomassariella vexata TaxID=1141098 RepID=A0A1Y2EG57_9PEZI|nr:amidase signature domain-containing protein [Pseudomassariella vexata]ORY70246.1 amidase signature domain-containing protein [Pseudomassariella vexata]